MVNAELYVVGLRWVMSSTSMASIVVVPRNRVRVTACVYVMMVRMGNIFGSDVTAVCICACSDASIRNEYMSHKVIEYSALIGRTGDSTHIARHILPMPSDTMRIYAVRDVLCLDIAFR